MGRVKGERNSVKSKKRKNALPFPDATRQDHSVESRLCNILSHPFCARPIKNIARNRSKAFKTEQSKLLSTPSFFPLRIFCGK